MDPQHTFEKELTLSSVSDAPATLNRLHGRPRIVRASEVLLSLAGRAMNGSPPAAATAAVTQDPGLESVHDALRAFPPLSGEEGVSGTGTGSGTGSGTGDVQCPDCGAVFSSSAELEGHYLTRYCPGSAVAVYVMTRDRLITKGYRLEKRFVALDCRPVRFFCAKCEKPFTMGEKERVHRHKRTPSLVECKHCGEKCNISYEPVLNDPRDSGSLREIPMNLASPGRSRSSSVTARRGPKVSAVPVSTSTSTSGDKSFSRRAKKLRDSWSTRKLSQADEDELVAVSFAGLYDLERVHAPNGVFQSLEPGAPGHPGGLANKRSALTLCEERDCPRASAESRDPEDEQLAQDASVGNNPKRHSLFQKLFGRKTPKGLSRSKSTNRGKKLMKRVNTMRFSFVSKEVKEEEEEEDESEKHTPSRPHLQRHTLQSQDDLNAMESTDAEYVALLRGCQHVFVHMQYLSGAAIVHDASGRQRILHTDEVAQLFLQLKDELSSATTWSRTLAMRARADSALKQGNLKVAVLEYLDTLSLLHDNTTPGLDADQLARAAILHGLGQAYRGLKMSVESQASLVESLALYKRCLGREHPRNFDVLHDLGVLFEKDGCAPEAAALYERSFAGRLKALGHNAPETLNSMQDLATAKIHLGDLEAALRLLRNAVPALDTVFGTQNGSTLNAMNKLALLYQKLGLNTDARALCARSIPHCRSFFGLFHPLTRDAVVRYILSLDSFDFPADIADVLDQYRRSRTPDSLKVMHRLGRAYMDAGLNRDAADLFAALVDDCMAVKGPAAPETFDALSALCVSREHLDSIDKAVHAYRQLVHMARRTPENHHSRRKIGYAERRIAELNRRRELLAAERKDWGLSAPAPCMLCGQWTRVICNSCKITRFCSEACHTQGIDAHIPSCIPSVSLHESKSLNVRPGCPPETQNQALLNIQFTDDDPADIHVLATYTYRLDPRNFTTFRMKLSATANTLVLFSSESDVQYALFDGGCPSSSSSSSSVVPTIQDEDGRVAVIPEEPSPSPNTATSTTGKDLADVKVTTPFQWTTPTAATATATTDTCCISSKPSPPDQGQSRYLLVTPGRDMLAAMIDRRLRVRSSGGDSQRFRALDVPSLELIEYAQGLMLSGYLGEEFMYVVEWEGR